LLALAAMQEGRNDEALEAAVAGVCFNPCATHGPRQRLREFATELNDAVLREVGQAQHGLVLARIRVSARERRGVFAPLGRIAADGSTTLEQLLADLSGASR
jgi:hypothetical protein